MWGGSATTAQPTGKADPRQHYPRQPPPRPATVDSEMGHNRPSLPLPEAQGIRIALVLQGEAAHETSTP